MSDKKRDEQMDKYVLLLKGMKTTEVVKVALPDTKYLVVAAAAAGAAKFFIDPAGSIVDAVVYGIGGAAVVTAAKLSLSSRERACASELLARGTRILEKDDKPSSKTDKSWNDGDDVENEVCLASMGSNAVNK